MGGGSQEDTKKWNHRRDDPQQRGIQSESTASNKSG